MLRPRTPRFQTFLGEVRGAALERGIRAETLDAVLPSISIHRQAVRAGPRASRVRANV
jgi:hypothetical protein